MLKIVFLAAVVCARGAVIPEGMVPQLDERIVGGQDTIIENVPWQASIQRNGDHICGGAIYSEYYIITAAHCLQNITASSLRVRVGSANFNTGGSLLYVNLFKIHENYRPSTMTNNIGLIRTNTYMNTNTKIRFIPLASYSPNYNAAAVVSGWGVTNYGSPAYSNTLKSVDLRIVDRNTCASSTYGYGSLIKSDMICANAVNKDACQGDSGGPLVSNGVLAGIVSWGFGCASPNYPGVYVDIAAQRNWILSNT